MEMDLNGSQFIAEKWTENGIEYMMLYLYDEQGAPIGLMYLSAIFKMVIYSKGSPIGLPFIIIISSIFSPENTCNVGINMV